MTENEAKALCERYEKYHRLKTRINELEGYKQIFQPQEDCRITIQDRYEALELTGYSNTEYLYNAVKQFQIALYKETEAEIERLRKEVDAI